MQSLDETFKDLQQRLASGRDLGSTGTDPIYYLVFPVSQILEAKRKLPAWRGWLGNQGWDVEECSMHKIVQEIFSTDKLRKFWLESEKMSLQHGSRSGDGFDTQDVTKTLVNSLTESGQIVSTIHAALERAGSKKRGILLITDLEALHPFLRINSIEAQMHGRVKCPVVVLYPGKREGKTSLRFLEIYPADPNYRSEHLG